MLRQKTLQGAAKAVHEVKICYLGAGAGAASVEDIDLPFNVLEAHLKQHVQGIERGETVKALHWYHLRKFHMKVFDIVADHIELSPAMRAQAAFSSSGKVELFTDRNAVALVAQNLTREEVSGGALENMDDSFRRVQLKVFFSKKYNTVVTLSQEDDPWNNVREQMRVSTSDLFMKMDGGALTFSLLDALLDKVEEVMDVYGDAVDGLEFMMTQHPPKHAQIKLSYTIKAHIWQIQRWAWSMRQMSEDIKDSGLFSDNCSRLATTLDGQCIVLGEIAAAFLGKCRTLEQYYENYNADLMNSTLNQLTIFTVAMVPPQFLTGLYGMNFVKENGDPNIPELMYPNSYAVLWACILIYWIIISLVIKKYGLYGNKEGKATSKMAEDYFESRVVVGMPAVKNDDKCPPRRQAGRR